MIKKQRGEYLMKKYFLISIAVLAALSLLLSGVSFAQGKRGAGAGAPEQVIAGCTIQKPLKT